MLEIKDGFSTQITRARRAEKTMNLQLFASWDGHEPMAMAIFREIRLIKCEPKWLLG